MLNTLNNNKINRPITLALSCLVALLGLVVIIGWLTSNTLLIQISTQFAPMQFNTALGFLLVGLGLALTILKYRKLSLISGGVVAMLALLTLGEYIFQVNLGIDELFISHALQGDVLYPGRMAPNTAFCFLLIGLYLFALNLTREGKHKKIIAGYLSLIVLIISSISIVGYSLGTTYAYTWDGIIRMAFHTSVGFILWSIAGNMVVLQEPDLAFNKKSAYIPIVIFITSTAIFIFIWHALVKKEIRDIEMILTMTENQVVRQFNESLNMQVNAMKRKARRWEVSGGLTESQWKDDTNAYIRDFPALESIVWTDQHYNEFMIMPPQKTSDGNYKFEIIFPMNSNGHSLGALIANFDVNKFVTPIISNQQARYDIQIKYQDNAIYQDGDPISSALKPYERSQKLQLGNMVWDMSIWPTQSTVAFYQSWTTGFVLIFGLFVAASLALGYWFLQSIKELNDKNKAILSELQVINKELEAFSYSVSHDLRAPLRHIKGFIGLLEKNSSFDVDETGRKHFQYVKEAADKMGELIDDLLEFSRAGRVEMRKEKIDLNEIVQKSLEHLNSEMEGRNIKWDTANLPTVSVDPVLMGTVFDNLLGNAIKFTKNKEIAEIKILVSEEEDKYIISVQDNGAGFDKQYTKKLFCVFQRLHTVDEFPGTGIGLANVQRIIHRHGGQTWAEGEVDKGASVYFSLPKRGETEK